MPRMRLTVFSERQRHVTRRGGKREKKEKKAGVEVTNQNSTLLLFENQKSQRHTWKRRKISSRRKNGLPHICRRVYTVFEKIFFKKICGLIQTLYDMLCSLRSPFMYMLFAKGFIIARLSKL